MALSIDDETYKQEVESMGFLRQTIEASKPNPLNFLDNTVPIANEGGTDE